MLKKFSKLLILLLIIFSVSFTACYATEAVTTSETETQTTTDDASTTDNIHYGDLYIVGNNIVLDKVVYGNVYIVANTVEFTGQIDGSLFVLANTLKFDNIINNGGLVEGSVYACASSIYFNGACTYLYALTGNIEMTYNSCVVRDANINCLNANIKAAIGRYMDLTCFMVNLGEGEDTPLFYGNLNYSSFIKPEIPEGIVTENAEDQINYTSPFSYSIVNILISLASTIITVLALYFILNKITPCFVEKLNSKKLSALNLLKAFGIGLATILAVAIVTLLLVITITGSKLAIIVALLFTILYFVSVPALSIAIAKVLKPVLKIEKTILFLLILSAVSIVLYGLTLIPFAGIVLSIIIKVTAIGLIVYNYLPHKELSDEEKAQKAEAKKLAKEEKAKRKQEKLEAKAAKNLKKKINNNKINNK